jgi:predicted transcriptional regulator
MSKMVAVRLDERLLSRVDQERRRRGVSRARAVHEASAAWVTRERLANAVVGRGEIWQDMIGRLATVTVAPITTTIRGVAGEVVVGTEPGSSTRPRSTCIISRRCRARA